MSQYTDSVASFSYEEPADVVAVDALTDADVARALAVAASATARQPRCYCGAVAKTSMQRQTRTTKAGTVTRVIDVRECVDRGVRHRRNVEQTYRAVASRVRRALAWSASLRAANGVDDVAERFLVHDDNDEDACVACGESLEGVSFPKHFKRCRDLKHTAAVALHARLDAAERVADAALEMAEERRRGVIVVPPTAERLPLAPAAVTHSRLALARRAAGAPEPERMQPNAAIVAQARQLRDALERLGYGDAFRAFASAVGAEYATKTSEVELRVALASIE